MSPYTRRLVGFRARAMSSAASPARADAWSRSGPVVVLGRGAVKSEALRSPRRPVGSQLRSKGMARPTLPQMLLAVAAVTLVGASLFGYFTRTTGDASSGLAHNSVRIADFAYGPAAVQVSAGDTVTWSNDDDFAHTVTSGADGPMDSGEIGSGGTYRVTFDAAGSFEYVCTIHPSMRGTVEVRAS